MYKNLNYTEKVCCWQWYRNREDSLETIEKNFQTNQIIENYANGRTDSLKCNKNHVEIPRREKKVFFSTFDFRLFSRIGFTRSMERDGEKMLEYYDKSRLDGLLILEVGPEYMREYYEYRQNRYKILITLKLIEYYCLITISS